MKRIIARLLVLSAVLCLFSLLSPSDGFAQSKTAAESKKSPQADKTLSSKSAPVVSVAPKSASNSALSYLSPLEREILEEMNLARTNPQQYAAYVEQFKTYYNGNRLKLPGRQTPIVTFDGIAAVDEAIGFLKAARPQTALEVNRGMSLAAKDHANDLALKGVSGHKGSDGSTPNARLERYGRWDGVVGENIVYDVSTAREIVIGLIIDDGTANRGHRRNIFDPNHRVAGISVMDSPANGAKCVLDYAGGFADKAGIEPSKSAPATRKL
ncbi:MAG TPA: CAP domain-containing protein [Pyrinomonadaceae bacterium]|nr:CAP domain-containing protein [Pyrinomonadaceae bacterium]